MISIVICHRNRQLLQELQQNIDSSIGTPYELVIIDNTKNDYNICQAYNEGAARSIYDIVCFAHEDILFHSQNWGQKVAAHFECNEVGMIGVIGGLAQPAVPAAWWYNTYYGRTATNLIMRKEYRDADSPLLLNWNNIYNENRTEVILVDGVWFCIRKSLFADIKFDAESFNRFHLYDADISMQVRQHKKNFVVYDIFIEHKWDAVISEDYYLFLEVFNKKWYKDLPLFVNRVSSEYLPLISWHSLRALLYDMRERGIARSHINELKEKYYPELKEKYPSFWFGLYFLCRSLIWEKLCFAIFYRLERLVGLNKDPGFKITEFKK